MPHTHRPRLLSGTLTLALIATACANTGLPDQPVLKDYAIKQKDFQLKSGLRVVVIEDHSTPLVVVNSVFGVGSTSDPKGVEGLAHFVEHLAFKSKPGGGPQVWDHLKRMGADFNASTSPDFTDYYIIAHKQHLPELMQLEAWRLAKTLDGVSQEEFDVEREVVRNEQRTRAETTVMNEQFDAILRQLFPPGHPLSRNIGGTHESLTAATLDHARTFVKEHYRPDNCTIVISGDVNFDEVGKMLGMWPAEVLFGPGGPNGPAVPPRQRLADMPPPPLPAPVSTALVRTQGPVMEPTLLIAWSLPAGFRRNSALLAAVGGAVDGAIEFGLDRDLKDDILGTFAFPMPMAHASVLFVYATLKAGADPEKARKRILDTIYDSWDAENARFLTSFAKWFGATSLLRTSGDPITSGLALGSHISTTGSSAYYRDELEALSKLRGTQVAEFAHTHLRRERAVALYYEPELTATSRGGGVGGGGGRTHQLGRGTRSNLIGMGPDDIRRVALPPGFARLPRTKMANGLEVIVVRRPSSLVTELFLRIPGGDATAQPYGLAGVARMASWSRCNEHGSLAPVGGTMGSSAGDLSTTMMGTVLAGNLVNGIAVLSDRVRCRDAEDEYFLIHEELVDREGARMKTIRARPQHQAEARFMAALYPQHPYGQVGLDYEALRKVTVAEARAFVHGHYRPEGSTLVVVGDTSPGEVNELANKYLASWQKGRTVAAAPPAVPVGPSQRQVIVIDRQGATQSAIRVGCRLAAPAPDTLPALDVVENIAQEKAWDIREKWGATYGVHARVGHSPGGAAHLIMDGPVETPLTGAAVKRLLEIVEEVGTEKLDVATFTTARWDLARQFNQRFAGAERTASAVLDAVTLGLPADVWDRYPENLANTSRAHIREIMQPCVGREVITIVGDAKAAREQLAQQQISVAP